MKPFSIFTKGIIAMSALASASALEGTFVYVSHAEDGDIGAWSMQADGALKALARAQAAKRSTKRAARQGCCRNIRRGKARIGWRLPASIDTA